MYNRLSTSVIDFNFKKKGATEIIQYVIREMLRSKFNPNIEELQDNLICVNSNYDFESSFGYLEDLKRGAILMTINQCLYINSFLNSIIFREFFSRILLIDNLLEDAAYLKVDNLIEDYYKNNKFRFLSDEKKIRLLSYQTNKKKINYKNIKSYFNIIIKRYIKKLFP